MHFFSKKILCAASSPENPFSIASEAVSISLHDCCLSLPFTFSWINNIYNWLHGCIQHADAHLFKAQSYVLLLPCIFCLYSVWNFFPISSIRSALCMIVLAVYLSINLWAHACWYWALGVELLFLESISLVVSSQG